MSPNKRPGYYIGELETECPEELQGMIEVTIHEVDKAPSRIINLNRSWIIDAQLSMTGSLCSSLRGIWLFNCYLESIGPGPDFQIESPGSGVPIDPDGNGIYLVSIPVPANIYGYPSSDGEAFFCKLVITVSYKDPEGKPGSVVGGYVQIPLVQFYSGPES